MAQDIYSYREKEIEEAAEKSTLFTETADGFISGVEWADNHPWMKYQLVKSCHPIRGQRIILYDPNNNSYLLALVYHDKDFISTSKGVCGTIADFDEYYWRELTLYSD